MTNPCLKTLIAVVGPTASGKSALALTVAERFCGEIVNFDSVQLYRGFDIGTAKVPLTERRGIVHHLLDLIDPNEQITAGDYACHAREILLEIGARGRLPVLVGGTGFYLRALIDGLFPGPTRNRKLREHLAKRVATRPTGYLHRLLNRLDAKAANRIHPNDHAKLIRAVEVCVIGRAPMSKLWDLGVNALEGYEVLRLGLNPPREKLRNRIEVRTQQIFNKGLLKEVCELLNQGVDQKAWPFGSLGYKQALAHFNGTSTIEQAVGETVIQTCRYAKRQMTWFRREPNVFWINSFGDESTTQEKACAATEQWLSDHSKNLP